MTSEVDPWSDRAASLISRVRLDLASGACRLIPRPGSAGKLLAAAGLSHACVLLEQLEAQRHGGDDLVARLIARAHYETWVTVMYLVLEPQIANDRLLQAHKKALEVQQRHLDDTTRRVAREAASNSEEVPPATTASPPELGFDLTRLIAELGEVTPKAMSFKAVDEAVGRLAKDRGESWAYNYALLYRSLSMMGAHPTYWVLNSYLTLPGSLVHVEPRCSASPLAPVAVMSAVGLTAFLASRVLSAFGIDVSSYDADFEHWVQRGLAPSP